MNLNDMAPLEVHKEYFAGCRTFLKLTFLPFLSCLSAAQIYSLLTLHTVCKIRKYLKKNLRGKHNIMKNSFPPVLPLLIAHSHSLVGFMSNMNDCRSFSPDVQFRLFSFWPTKLNNSPTSSQLERGDEIDPLFRKHCLFKSLA